MTKTNINEKISYYQNRVVVETYDRTRFGGGSGNYVNCRELDMVRQMVPSHGKFLDFPCGTGRITRFLLRRGLNVIAADRSLTMLGKAEKGMAITPICGNLFAPPFKDESFDCITSIRFAFHFQNIEKFLTETSGLLKHSGVLVFDTYRWSPLSMRFPFLRKIAGGRMYIHSQKKVCSLCEKFNLEVAEVKNCFLFSPFAYRYLPFIFVVILDKLEELIPQRFLTVTFWKLRKI